MYGWAMSCSPSHTTEHIPTHLTLHPGWQRPVYSCKRAAFGTVPNTKLTVIFLGSQQTASLHCALTLHSSVTFTWWKSPGFKEKGKRPIPMLGAECCSPDHCMIILQPPLSHCLRSRYSKGRSNPLIWWATEGQRGNVPISISQMETGSSAPQHNLTWVELLPGSWCGHILSWSSRRLRVQTSQHTARIWNGIAPLAAAAPLTSCARALSLGDSVADHSDRHKISKLPPWGKSLPDLSCNQTSM